MRKEIMRGGDHCQREQREEWNGEVRGGVVQNVCLS